MTIKQKQLVTHPDTRGFFREILRASDEIMTDFGQLSHSMMYTGTIKAWHYHKQQTDLWYVAAGVILAAVCQLDAGQHPISEVYEYGLGDNAPGRVLCIPPGWAHGLKVLQGPAHLIYVTSREYDPDDEGRLPYDALAYDWFKQDIR
jgi:dTDP-4-dehydrorhamnose 3,5-epimerase